LDHLRSSFAPADPKKHDTFVRLTEQLKTEVARINRHISDFLKYSRPTKLELQGVDVRAEAEDALRIIEPRVEERGIQTEIVQDGELPKILADPESLRSVFTNLVINAVEAIDGSGGTVSIHLSKATNDSVRIEISDTGCGIPADDIGKVFEPYFSTKDTGTGLGLAIVKKAIEDHGGTIAISSKQGSWHYVHNNFTGGRERRTDGGRESSGLMIDDCRLMISKTHNLQSSIYNLQSSD
jgi:signal transduction histidine kinase